MPNEFALTLVLCPLCHKRVRLDREPDSKKEFLGRHTGTIPGKSCDRSFSEWKD